MHDTFNACKVSLKKFSKSIWFFPVLLLFPLIALTSLSVHGSSIGFYNNLFYGDQKDPDLILGRPRTIRSDEWIVNTQMTISQKYNNYNQINNNIGNGQDLSILVDAPYKDWSALFKPHNFAFFVLPFNNAFAFRWWSIGYLLIVSMYFLFIFILGNKKLLSSLLAISIFFSPFIQWWYLNGTVSTISFGILCLLMALKILNEKKSKKLLLLSSAGLIYSSVSFVLILYPPFQIPVVFVSIIFGIAYLLKNKSTFSNKMILQRLVLICACLFVAATIVGTYVVARQNVINIVQNTAYPGNRTEPSGGYNIAHLFSSHLSFQFQSTSSAQTYQIPESGLVNQSASSNFILLMPFLILPCVYFIYWKYKKIKIIDWQILLPLLLFSLFFLKMFIHKFDFLYKLLLLDQVSSQRMVIGVGLLNILFIIVFIKSLSEEKKLIFTKKASLFYAFLVFILEIYLSFYAKNHYPGFISAKTAIVLSFPIPMMIFFILRKKFIIASVILLVFSGISSGLVNPLYHGTDVISKTNLSNQIREVVKTNPGSLWVTEGIYIENFAQLNGARSLAGVHPYPQLDLWKNIENSNKDDYNRYAHVNFAFDREPDVQNDTKIKLVGGDNFQVITEPCSTFLKDQDVKFVVALAPFDNSNTCSSLISEIKYPKIQYYIYRLGF